MRGFFTSHGQKSHFYSLQRVSLQDILAINQSLIISSTLVLVVAQQLDLSIDLRRDEV